MISNELFDHVLTMKYQQVLPLCRIQSYFETMKVKILSIPYKIKMNFPCQVDGRSSVPATVWFIFSLKLISDNSNTPNGKRFSIRLSSLFTKVNGVISIDDLNTVTRTNIPVQNSPGNFQYNHYVLEFRYLSY